VTGEGPPSNVPPAAFGRLRVPHQIGAGSLGPVFRAEEPALQAAGIIKVLRRSLTPERARTVADELSALQDRIPAHPGIAPSVKAGIRDVEPFVVCASVAGDSLDVTLRELGPSALPEALPRLVQIAAGLDFCADASIWHGALHPRDVLLMVWTGRRNCRDTVPGGSRRAGRRSVTSSTRATAGAKVVGSLLVESRPVGAKVFIDGRVAGITPMMLERLAPGAHAVRLELTGYHPWTTTASVVLGEMTRLAASLAGGQEDQ
jgi:hypothetical protein